MGHRPGLVTSPPAGYKLEVERAVRRVFGSLRRSPSQQLTRSCGVCTGRWPAARRSRRSATDHSSDASTRVLHRPGVNARRWVRIAEQLTRRGGHGADRVPVGDRAQHRGHVLGRHERVGDDRQREEDDEADPLRRLGTLADHAEAGAAPGQAIAEQQEDAEAGERSRRRSASGRQPIASPVAATNAAQIAAVSRSASERPTSTAGRHIGSVRKRSITPLFRSVLSPTAVPIEEVVRFIASRPAIANSL